MNLSFSKKIRKIKQNLDYQNKILTEQLSNSILYNNFLYFLKLKVNSKVKKKSK